VSKKPESFGPIAPHYDVLMRSVPYDMWLSYYQLLLAQQEVYPEKLLDVCCGTGTLCEKIAALGYSVAGIDLSAAMIERARAKAKELELDIRYEAVDAAEFDLGERFEAAYSFFDSFNYITDLGHLQKALHRIAHHLKPGGSLVFDLNTSYAFEEKMFDQEDRRKKSPIQYKWKGDYNPTSRIIHVTMDFWIDGENFQEVHVQRAHSQEEIFEMLKVAGFHQIACYDSYTLEPPRKRSDRIHFTAIRE